MIQIAAILATVGIIALDALISNPEKYKGDSTLGRLFYSFSVVAGMIFVLASIAAILLHYNSLLFNFKF